MPTALSARDAPLVYVTKRADDALNLIRTDASLLLDRTVRSFDLYGMTVFVYHRYNGTVNISWYHGEMDKRVSHNGTLTEFLNFVLRKYW